MDWHCNLLLSKKQLLKALRAWINYSCNRRYLPSCNQNARIRILYYHGTMSFLPCHAMPFPPSLMCRTPGRNTANKAESSKTCLCWISLLPLKKHRQSNPMMFHNRKCYGTKWTEKQEICKQIWTGELVYRQTMLLWHISLSRKTSENECLGSLKVRFEQMYTSVYQHNTTQTESCGIQ